MLDCLLLPFAQTSHSRLELRTFLHGAIAVKPKPVATTDTCDFAAASKSRPEAWTAFAGAGAIVPNSFAANAACKLGRHADRSQPSDLTHMVTMGSKWYNNG